jgi:hypothetical protein
MTLRDQQAFAIRLGACDPSAQSRRAWFLALELVAVLFSRRGWDLKQRRELLSI